MGTEFNETKESSKGWQANDEGGPFVVSDWLTKPGDFTKAVSAARPDISAGRNADNNQSLVLDNIFLAMAPVPAEGPKPPTKEQLSKQEKADAAAKVEFPNLDPTHARLRGLAVKEQLGDPPLSFDEAKSLYTERYKQRANEMFPNDEQARDLYLKEKLTGSSYAGKYFSDDTLSDKERDQNEKNIQDYLKRKGSEERDNPNREPDEEQKRLQALAEKAFLHENNLGPALTPQEKAFFQSKNEFPDDKHFQKLAEKQYLKLREGLGDGLTQAETAELNGKRAFPAPKDAFFAKLAAKEEFSINGKGPALTADEKADLFCKREFPEAGPYNRALAKKLSKSESGDGPPLTPSEESKLFSSKEFPESRDVEYRSLAEKEILSRLGGPPLTASEEAKLASKREFKYEEHLRALAEQQNLFQAGLGEALHPDDKDRLDAARRDRTP